MQSDESQPGSPEDWMRRAHSDLQLAKISRPPGVMLESLCFHAQQAAEKALKAVLISLRIPFAKTHSIRMLLDLFPETLPLPEGVEEAASLTDYVVMGRYPGDTEPVEEEEYQEAVNMADTVVSWAEEAINRKVV